MTRKKRKKRVRWGRLFTAIILFSIFMAGLFQIYQYIERTIKTFNQPFQKVDGDESAKSAKGREKLTFQGETINNEVINVLLLGSDSRGEKAARTDTIMVAHYHPETHRIKLISLMRDMLVNVPEHGEQKLNAAFSYGGPELLRQTIKENLGLDLHYYAVVDFQGFEKAVDLLVPNGIEVDIPYEMSHGIGMTLEPGKQQLHGKELLGYVRFRHDQLSDFGRIQRQQEAISKLTEEAVGMHSLVKLPELLDLLNTYIDSNIDSSTLLAIGKDIMTKKSSDVETLRIPEDGSFENLSHEQLGDVLEVDFEQNKEVLKNFLVDKSVAQNKEY